MTVSLQKFYKNPVGFDYFKLYFFSKFCVCMILSSSCGVRIQALKKLYSFADPSALIKEKIFTF